MTKIFEIGDSHGQYNRAISNVTVQIEGQVPVLDGKEKDHKLSKKIKMRPTVNSMNSPKKNTSGIYSDVLMGVVKARDKGILCTSTEELIEALVANYKTDKKHEVKNKGKRIISSMDAVSLFTNLEAERSSDIVREETVKSKVKFNNIDIQELGIYLRKNTSNEDINKRGFDDILPKYSKIEKDQNNETLIDMYEIAIDIEQLFIEDMFDEYEMDEESEDKKEEENKVKDSINDCVDEFDNVVLLGIDVEKSKDYKVKENKVKDYNVEDEPDDRRNAGYKVKDPNNIKDSNNDAAKTKGGGNKRNEEDSTEKEINTDVTPNKKRRDSVENEND